MAELMLAYCRVLSLDNFIAFVRNTFDEETKTCKVSAQTFAQRLTRQLDGDKNVWVVDDKPTGPCGIIRLDQFELDNPKFGGFWNYFFRKAVTNPSGSALLLKCAKLDQAEYKFQWQSRPIDLECETIKFSPF